MRKLVLGLALVGGLMIGAPAPSYASPVAPATPELYVQTTGTILVNNEAPLSNQSAHDEEDDDNNGNNGGE